MWHDAHGSGAGYLSSPIEGTIHDLVARIANLADGVQVDRRLGVAVEHAAHAREMGLDFQWGGPWVDAAPHGLRATVPSSVLARVIEGLAKCGMDWLCCGASTPAVDVRRLTAVAASVGLRVALEVGPDAVTFLDSDASAALDTTLEGLLPSVTAIASADGVLDSLPRVPQEALVALGRCHPAPERIAATLLRWGRPIVPLLAAVRYSSDISALVTAEGMTELTSVLPHHSRIMALRQPGALAMGRREAMRYLGLRVLSAAERSHLTDGWRLLHDVLAAYAAGGGQLLLGSGAPGLGLHPYFALVEELRIWRQAGVPEDACHATHLTPARLLKEDHVSSHGH